jgi:hypothetical protein
VAVSGTGAAVGTSGSVFGQAAVLIAATGTATGTNGTVTASATVSGGGMLILEHQSLLLAI